MRIRELWAFTIGFTCGAAFVLALLTARVRDTGRRLQEIDRGVDRLIEEKRQRECVDDWRRKYGLWVQTIENPPDDPPPAGAREERGP